MTDDILKEYYRWYEKTYAKVIGLNDFKKRADNLQINWLSESINEFKYEYSSIWRHEVLTNMRFYLYPKKTEYICTSFKITRKAETSIFKAKNIQYHSIYAILYTSVSFDDSSDGLSSEKNNKKSKKSENVGKPVFKHEFVTVCPTFKSADGEYRHRFISCAQLLGTYDLFKEAYNNVEEHITNQLYEDNILLEANFIIPDFSNNVNIIDKKDKITKALKKDLDKNRFAILFYISAWIIDFNRFINKRLENHIADGYKEAMFSTNDESFYNKWIKVYGDKINEMVAKLIRFKKDLKQSVSALEIGQKFVPITISDTEQIGNIKHTPWKEMYINSLLGDLVINGITPSLPIFNDWFLIMGNDFTFWDNRISHLKLDHSEIATDIVKKLEIARKGTYMIDPIKKKEMYLSFNMEGLSEAIDIPMEYAEQQIILSNIILCSLNEHVGKTLADLPSLLMDDNYYKLFYGPLFQNYYLFSKLIFEYIYCLFSLNSFLGIIHGDLHLNNVTLFLKRMFISSKDNKTPLMINPHIIYEVFTKPNDFDQKSNDFDQKSDKQTEATEQGKSDIFIFPHFGSTACIIDFSRAFLSYNFLIKHFNESTTEEVIFYQRTRIARTLEREIPDFYQSNKDKIQIALLEDFNSCYKVFMAIDSYKLSKGVISLINFDVLGQKDRVKKYVDYNLVTKSILPLLEKINSISYDYLTSNFISIFNKKNIDHVENINLIIIKECFKSNHIKNFEPPLHNGVKKITLADYFTNANNIKYNTRNYDDFPETVKFDYIIEHKIPVEQMGIENYENYKKYNEYEPVTIKLNNIKETIIKNKPERRGLNELYKNDIAKNIGVDKHSKKDKAKDFTNESSEIGQFYFET